METKYSQLSEQLLAVSLCYGRLGSLRRVGVSALRTAFWLLDADKFDNEIADLVTSLSGISEIPPPSRYAENIEVLKLVDPGMIKFAYSEKDYIKYYNRVNS